MPLATGTRLGPFEILGPLGAGGMGEGYRGRDAKLGRDVALKVLPPALANDAEYMARFHREAQVLAALNHPNIAAIYGLEDRAIVMELVEGLTLADRIEQGPIPIDEALNIARQIAEAFEYAHEKGVIHRDLKPANVKVTPEGTVKVLDFGLAKMAEVIAPRGNPETSPTLTLGATVAGMILGTAAYMAPEQAAGKPVDRRADIWSFGVVLHEMLTGRRLFKGETVAHTLAAVLQTPLDWEKTAAPPAIKNLLRRCLDRDVKTRLQVIGEARIAITKFLANPDVEVATAPAAAVPSTRKTARAISAAVALIAAVTAFGWWKSARPVERPLVHLDVDLGAEASLGFVASPTVIISPDGTRLVFVSKGRLFTRRLNQPKATELAGTEGAFAPFFSPDGQWVAFFGGGKLKKISVEGGAAIALCDAPVGRGGAWGEDQSIVVALTSVNGILSRIPGTGGTLQPLTELAQGEFTHRWPKVLPGGKAVLFTASRASGGYDNANIEAMSYPGGARKTLLRGGTFGRYLPAANGAGHLVYVNKGTLFAVALDPDSLEISGTPVPVLPEVSSSPITGTAQFDFSKDGTLVYRGGIDAGMVMLQWIDAEGKAQSLPAKPGLYGQPRLSPDGKLAALTVGGDIWTYDWRRDAMSKLTFGDGNYNFPAWSPDARYLVFRSESGGILWTRADGSGKPGPLTQSKMNQFPWSFSPDGKRLAYSEDASGAGDLWTVPVENEGGALRAGKPEVFLQTPADERSPVFSPDGRWIAYRSSESGTNEIPLRAFPDKGGKWQISNSGGVFPIWSRNGRELFYRTQDQQIMVVTYTTNGDSFVPDKPRLWSPARLAGISDFHNLDISPDGKRFLALMPAEAQGQQRTDNHVTFLLNFGEEVRRRMAAGKQ